MTTSLIEFYNSSLIQRPSVFQDFKDKTLPWAQKTIHTTYSKCERTWSYLGKIVLITRHSLRAAAKDIHLVALAGMQFPKIVGEITTQMKLFAIVSIPFSIGDVASATKKIFYSLLMRDPEGVALSTLSFTIIAADIVDSFTTFVNAILMLSIGAPLEVFSALGLPLAFTMAGGGTVSRVIQIAKSSLLHHSISREVLSQNEIDCNFLKSFLEKTLGINEELKNLLSICQEQLTEKHKARIQLLKNNNKAAILRAAPAESVKELESLLAILEKHNNKPLSQEMQRAVSEKFKTIQSQIIKKITADVISVFANLFSLVALTLFFIGSTTPLPNVLLAIAFAIRLGVVIYNNQKISIKENKCIGTP